jgi:hypothetical protein
MEIRKARNSIIRISLPEKIKFEQRLEEVRELSIQILTGEHSRE